MVDCGADRTRGVGWVELAARTSVPCGNARRMNNKLTEQQVNVIRRARAIGVPNVALAARFKVSRVAITDIVGWHTWRHLSERECRSAPVEEWMLKLATAAPVGPDEPNPRLVYDSVTGKWIDETPRGHPRMSLMTRLPRFRNWLLMLVVALAG